MSALWLPGQGMVSLEGTAVDRAVRAYDERLFYARNGDTGQWCVFMNMPHGEAPLPVLGFPNEPTPEEAVAKLQRTDARKRGLEILNEINAHNERVKQPFREAAELGDWLAAERIEHGMRQDGLTGYAKVFMDGKGR